MNDDSQLLDISAIISELNMSESFIGVVARSLKNHGLDVNDVFTAVDLAIPAVNNPIERTSFDQFGRLIEHITAVSGDPCIGVKIFSGMKSADLSALGFAISCSTSLLGVAERLQRFLPYLISSGHFEIIDEGSEALIIIDPPTNTTAGDRALTQVVECFYAVATAVIHEISGKKGLFQQMLLPQVTDRTVQSYLKDFGQCEVISDAPFLGFKVSKEVLTEPLPSANPEMARLNDILLTEQLNKIYKSNIIFRVEQLVQEGLESGKFGKSDIASQLAMSERTLHQKLEEKGAVFGDIVTRIRKNLAMQYIKSGELRINQIAYKLGFASASNFSRSFKHWTGCTPKEFKEL